MTNQNNTISATSAVSAPVSFMPAAANLPAAGGTGSFAISTAVSGFGWKAAASDPWIALQAPVSGSGAGSVAYSVSGNPTAAERSGSITVAGEVFVINQDAGPAPIHPQTGWWWYPYAPGIGFFIEQQPDTNIFLASFLYAVSGRATWLVSSNSIPDASYNGNLLAFGGGQTLTGPYQQSTFTGSPGEISIQFSDETHATLTWPGGTIPIQRFGCSGDGLPAVPGAVENGWWWNPAESGRGFAIEVQNGSVYICGFMYDDLGNPIWYLATGVMTSPMLYTGRWMQFGNGETLTGLQQPASLVSGDVGPLTIQFTGASDGIMTLPGGRQIPITRFHF